MVIPHWMIGVAIFAALGTFIVFAFRQGQSVKPDRNKDPNDWTRQTAAVVRNLAFNAKRASRKIKKRRWLRLKRPEPKFEWEGC